MSSERDTFVLDAAGKVLYRSTPGVNLSIGAVHEFICKTLGISAVDYGIFDAAGKRLRPTVWLNAIPVSCGNGASWRGTPRYVTMIRMTGQRPVIEPLALRGHGYYRGGTYHWTTPVERVDLPKTKRRRTEALDVRYDRIPMSIVNIIVGYVDNPVTLMDLRRVCRDFRDFIDDNLRRLIEPFRVEIFKSCLASRLRKSVDMETVTPIELLHVVSWATVRLSPPLTADAKIDLLKFICTPRQVGHSSCHWTRMHTELRKMMAASRDIWFGRNGNSYAWTSRMLRAARAVMTDEQIACTAMYCSGHQAYGTIGDSTTGFYEMWIGAGDELVHIAQINLVRVHAMLMSLGWRLWALRDECANCRSSVHTFSAAYRRPGLTVMNDF